MTKKKTELKKEAAAPQTQAVVKANGSARKPITQTALRAVSVLIHSQLSSKTQRLLQKIETEVYQLQLSNHQKDVIAALADHISRVENDLGVPVIHSNYASKANMCDNALRRMQEQKRRELLIAAGYTPDAYNRFNQEQKDIPSITEIQAKLTLSSLGKENFQDLLELVAKDYDLDIKQLNGFGKQSGE